MKTNLLCENIKFNFQNYYFGTKKKSAKHFFVKDYFFFRNELENIYENIFMQFL